MTRMTPVADTVDAGVGYFTQLFTQSFDQTKLLGLISVLAAMAIVLNEIIRRRRLHFGRWRQSETWWSCNFRITRHGTAESA